MTAKKTTTKKAKTATAKTPAKAKLAKPKKSSALDCAALVLAGAGCAMSAKEMIEAMLTTKMWKSPGGKTPDASLYAAIIREIAAKGKGSRFKKTEPGKFAATGVTGKESAAAKAPPAKPPEPKGAKVAKKKGGKKKAATPEVTPATEAAGELLSA